jgi:hypothetical protein
MSIGVIAALARDQPQINVVALTASGHLLFGHLNWPLDAVFRSTAPQRLAVSAGCGDHVLQSIICSFFY